MFTVKSFLTLTRTARVRAQVDDYSAHSLARMNTIAEIGTISYIHQHHSTAEAFALTCRITIIREARTKRYSICPATVSFVD
jgi:hypothetical protein